MNLLTVENIFYLHRELIKRYGGTMGYYNDTSNKVNSILAQQEGYFGIDKYPSIFDKSGMLLYHFAKGHCFVDGNKRVALHSALTLLYANGYDDIIGFDDDEAYNLTIEVACSSFRGIEVDNYIKIKLSPWFEKNFYKV